MKKKPVKDISASVRARLLNLARSTGRDFQELTIRYTVERFLARLAESELRKRREQIEKLQLERQNLENKRLEAKARIEHTMEKLDVLAAENVSAHS